MTAAIFPALPAFPGPGTPWAGVAVLTPARWEISCLGGPE